MTVRRTLAILLFALPTTLFGSTLYVTAEGMDGGDCVTAPCHTVRFALIRAVDGDVIEVGPGRFYGDEVTKSVTLRGAQAGIDARGRTLAAESILSSISLEAEGITLDGFTIECGDSCGATIRADPGTGDRILNNIIRGGGFQVSFFGTDELPSEIRFNEFAGVKLHSGAIGMPFKTYGVTIGSSAVEGPSGLNVRIDSNRFTGSSEAMLSMSNVIGTHDGIDITNNELVLGDTGRGFDLTNVTGARIAGNTISGGYDPAILLSANRNVQVTGNTIRGNRDTAVLTLNGGEALRLEGNTLLDNARALAVSTDAGVHFNRFAGNGADIQSLSTVSIEAENNWFGCNEGPSRCGHISVSNAAFIDVSPWLVMTVSASPDRIAPLRSSVITADFNHNSDGQLVAGFPDGTPILFSSTGGSLSSDRGLTAGGIASATFTSTTTGEAAITTKLDQSELSPLRIVTVQPRRRATGTHQ
jgi:parallel beta-helix repeat protein